MSTNNFSKETEIRLTEFFTNIIDPKEMAKAIRQVNYIWALSVLRECETLPEKSSIENSFYCMNRLAEALDPYLDVD
jgi:hypothetical protein